MEEMLEIRPAIYPEDLHTVKRLFREYAESLGFDLDFQDFDAEMERFPGNYAPPAGKILVAEQSGSIVGCVALRPLSESLCEMKRLYVRPSGRQKGGGRKLAERIILEAKRMGYRAMRLDTVPDMKQAIRLYKELGFKQIPPYCYNPIPGALFFELEL